MGFVYNLASIDPDKLDKLMFPIIFCTNKTKISKYVNQYTRLSLNKTLSKRLLSYKQDKRKLFILDELNNIVKKQDGSLFIQDFEILFDPNFQIDVLKTFILLNRYRKIAVLWPGIYKNKKLIFAEPGYKDYKVYNIDHYDINCII